MQERRKLELGAVFRVFFGWVPLPAAVTGLIFTVVYITAAQHAIRRRRVSRKCYLLLLNKAVGDALCSLAAIVVVIYVLLSNETRYASSFENTAAFILF